MKDIRLTIRAKNNILTSLREEQGMSIPLMSAMIGISKSVYGCYETMATSPINSRTNKIKDTAKLIMRFYDLPFEALWTEGVLNIKETKFIVEIDSTLYLEDVKEKLMLPSPEEEIIERDLAEKQEKLRELLDKALVTLTQREERVLKEMFYEGKTLEKIAEEFDLTRERIRQIKLKALRKLKHPSRKLSNGGKAVDAAKQEFL